MAVAPAGVPIYVNDKVVATVTAKDLEKWPRLDTFLPNEDKRIGSWTSLQVLGKSGKPVKLDKPGDSYRDQALALFVADGQPAFGIFDMVELSNHGNPQLREDGLKEVRIAVDLSGGRGQNEQGGGGGGDPLAIKISVKTPKGESTLEGATLMKLPREGEPDKPDSKGWKLSVVLKAAGIEKWEKVVVSDGSGNSLPVEKKDFDDVNVIPFVKLNKQATLRLRIYKKQGTGWKGTGDIRGITTIEQTK